MKAHAILGEEKPIPTSPLLEITIAPALPPTRSDIPSHAF